LGTGLFDRTCGGLSWRDVADSIFLDSLLPDDGIEGTKQHDVHAHVARDQLQTLGKRADIVAVRRKE